MHLLSCLEKQQYEPECSSGLPSLRFKQQYKPRSSSGPPGLKLPEMISPGRSGRDSLSTISASAGDINRGAALAGLAKLQQFSGKISQAKVDIPVVSADDVLEISDCGKLFCHWPSEVFCLCH